MIWNESQSSWGDAASAERLITKVQAFCGDMCSLSREHLHELAHAVTHFMDEQQLDPETDARYMVMLASQALSSVGDAASARRLMVFGSGLVRGSEWEVKGREMVWTLDLRKITVRADVMLELVFFRCLDVVLGSIAEVWDESDGEGTLGLKHVVQTAASLAGSESKREHARIASDILDACSARLARMADERGWRYYPQVMNLDVC